MTTTDDLKSKHERLLQKLRSQVHLDQNNLSSEMARNSSLMFSVGLLRANAEYLKDRAENRLKIIEAQIDKAIRDRASGKKKPSEQQIKNEIAKNPKVVAAQQALIEAKWKFNVCWTAATSIAQKGEQLSNLGHNYRKELESGIVKKRTIDERLAKTNKLLKKQNKGKGEDHGED